MHRTYLGGIETARRNPSLRNIIRLARALGVPIAGLFEELAASSFSPKRSRKINFTDWARWCNSISVVFCRV